MLPSNPIKKAISDPTAAMRYIKNRPTLPLHIAADTILRNTISTYVFEEDWELLIILDALRADTAQKEISTYDIVKKDETVWSPASHSSTWIKHNFTENNFDDISRTAYISANPHSEEIAGANFGEMREVWKTHWASDVGTVPPQAVTDECVRSADKINVEKIIVHYMQPHFPSLSKPDLGTGWDPKTNEWHNSVWQNLESGKLKRSVVWKSYKQNLHNVMDHVIKLCGSLDMEKIILTSDHGNLFGECGVYGHPQQFVHPKLRKVPWYELNSTVEANYTPQTDASTEKISDEQIEKRLSALGYK